MYTYMYIPLSLPIYIHISIDMPPKTTTNTTYVANLSTLCFSCSFGVEA